ncbi:MAG: acetoin utilization protein AcuC [Proteobacteria bacterium]|jgi:acetoin utilization protein AcuC|nr:acetoin utilization protein AcuC [Pseudomonadota bacterium]
MPVCVCTDPALGRYSFGAEHPFGPKRFDAFYSAFREQGLEPDCKTFTTVQANQAQLEYFHTHEYVERVKLASLAGSGYLDRGDTPAFPGVYEAAATVAGTALKAVDLIMRNECTRAFTPIAGLHHARRDSAAGFCVFNDCGIVIEALRRDHGVKRIAYVDIDAHHGDGVFYSFETDPDLIFVDLHEDGNYLYPGTGEANETGRDMAVGTKLNVPLPMGAGDAAFDKVWSQAEDFIRDARPEFILLQCGADSLQGDPITHMAYSSHAHARAAASLSEIADQCCQGRLLAMGGGGYNLENIAAAWTAVVATLMENKSQA